MKKFICYVVALGMCLSILPLSGYATEANDSGCFIASVDCPEEYITYVKNNISTFILSMNESFDITQVSIGTPFTFSNSGTDVFYFPVIYKENIKYLFRVYLDRTSYTGVISDFLADEINALAPLTSYETPMYLSLVDNRIIADIGEKQYILFTYPEDISGGGDASVLSTLNNVSVKNIKADSHIIIDWGQPRDVYEYVNLNISETQEIDESWCLAYCLAAVIRTKTNFYATARGLMTKVYGQQFKLSDTFPYDKISSILSEYNLTATIFWSMPSNTMLVQELSNGWPSILIMSGGQGAHTNHAVVLRGWSSVGTWSIWNPWLGSYETFVSGQSYVPTGFSPSQYSYTPTSAVSNFR